MHEDRPFTEYLNEFDDEGRPIKHVHWPDHLPKPVEKLIIELIDKRLEDYGIPIDKKQSKKLFGFMEGFKDTCAIVYKSFLGVLVLAVVAGAVILIREK